MKIIFLFLAMSTLAAEPPVRVVLELNDNSRLPGEMPAQTIAVVSPTLGALKVSLDRVSLIRMEHDSASFLLRNGDKLQGKPVWKEVNLTTKRGERIVPLSQLRQLETLDADGLPTMLDNGLLLHLRFDRANNPGKIHDAKPAAGHRGQPKTALEFDGKKSWVEVGIDTGQRFGQQITMCAWVKHTGNSDQIGLIVAADATYPSGARLGLWPNEGVEWTAVLEGDEDIVLPQPADLASWTLVVATYNGVSNELYLNGQLFQTKRAPDELAWHSNSFAIGGGSSLLPNGPLPPAPADGAATVKIAVPDPADAGEMADWFEGLIDEVRIYNRALTAEEVRALYDATK